MVFDEQGRPFMALEAQLSPMTPDEARMRTERYAANGVAVCWVGPQDRPWQRVVPTLRVPFPTGESRSWQVRHGMALCGPWAPSTVSDGFRRRRGRPSDRSGPRHRHRCLSRGQAR
ncbi:competence protein CoiA family protein [Streptomyces sp. NPDC054901]